MADKATLRDWVLEALKELGGSGGVVAVSKVVWRRHEHDLRQSGDLFYTWQYDLRWAAQKLRNDGQLAPVARGANSKWTLR